MLANVLHHVNSLFSWHIQVCVPSTCSLEKVKYFLRMIHVVTWNYVIRLSSKYWHAIGQKPPCLVGDLNCHPCKPHPFLSLSTARGTATKCCIFSQLTFRKSPFHELPSFESPLSCSKLKCKEKGRTLNTQSCIHSCAFICKTMWLHDPKRPLKEIKLNRSRRYITCSRVKS